MLNKFSNFELRFNNNNNNNKNSIRNKILTNNFFYTKN